MHQPTLAPSPADAEQAENLTKDAGALVCAPEMLFDGASILQSIEAIAGTVEAGELRTQTAQLLREENQRARNIVEENLTDDMRHIGTIVRSYAYIVDEVARIAFHVATTHLNPVSNPSKSERLSVLAVGGYGRSEMAPFSDVDLLFLTPQKITPWAEQVVEHILYILWDVKLKIGHASRSIQECIALGNQDQTIKTALIEARYLCGDQDTFDAFDNRLWTEIRKRDQSAYVQEKLDERAQRHKRQGQRYMVEPNVKEGKGGLRDLQSMYWITKYISGAKRSSDMIRLGYLSQDEFKAFLNAHRFLWMVRCHLHLVAGRPVEQLTFDHQVEVARRLGYTTDDAMRAVEHFMQDYFRHATKVGELTRIYLTALEDQHIKSTPSIADRLRMMMSMGSSQTESGNALYKIRNERLDLAEPDDFLKDPLNILHLFQEALASGRLIHPNAMRVITANLHLIDEKFRASSEAQDIFLSLLLDYGNPERALRRMNELGVLGAFIPEFARIQALMQYNTYHSYTVDEHTIQCVSVLARIENGDLKEELPIVSGILKQGVNRRVLYVALLLHDIGKGLPENHSIAGARLAAEIAPALGLEEAEVETVVWLVENHLVMSDFAQKRDLSDPRTVSDFAKAVKSSSRLNLLAALTTCDIMGVGPDTLTQWKAQLLRNLYNATRSLITDGLDQSGTYNPAQEAQEALAKRLSDWTAEARTAELERHYDAYWRGLDTDAQEIIANLIPQVNSGDFVSAFDTDVLRNATRAVFVLEDHPGVFSRITGALALSNANIVDARTYTSSDGLATSVFWIQTSQMQPFETTRLPRLKSAIRKTLMGEVLARSVLREQYKIKKREREFRVPTEITIDNSGSELYSIIEVDTRDRPSLLFDLTRTIADLNLTIGSAVIATYGAQAVDVFYVKDMFGLKIHAKDRQAKIKARLMEAIQDGAKAAEE